MIRFKRVILPALTVAVTVASMACTDTKNKPAVLSDALADSADQIMDSLSLNLTAYGVNRALLLSDTAYFLDNNTRVELKNVTTLFYATTGEQNATLTSRRGQYLSNSDHMTARDSVVIVTTDGRELRTSEIMYDRYANRISSDSAFVLTEPNRRLEGIGFESDPELNNLKIFKATSGTAGPVNLPTE